MGYSACNAQPCDPKKLQLTAAEMAEKLEETKLAIANATKTSSEEKAKIVQLKKNATAAMAAEKAAHKKLEGMKVALSAAQTKSSKLAIELKKVKKARFPAMHRILQLSAMAGTLTGQARLDVLTEIRQLSKSAAKASKSASTANNDIAKARDALKLSIAGVASIKKSIPVQQAAVDAAKKKTQGTERSVKRSEWKERTQKHIKVKSTEWMDWEKGQLKKLKKLKVQVNEMGEELGEKNETSIPKKVNNSSAMKPASPSKEAKINIHAAQQDAAKAAAKEGPAKATVRAVEAKYQAAAKVANDTNITEALQRDLDNAQQDEERAKISSNIAKIQNNIVAAYRRLKDTLSACVEDTTRSACVGIERAQEAARSEISEMRQDVET